MTDRLFISFSGGETSAYMTKRLLDEQVSDYDEVEVVFANTGQEREETLEFVQRCDDAFGFGVTWVEAVTHHGKRKGCTHRVVDFASADRDGAVFEDVIRKYGIPNKSYPHCTRELKLNPMTSYLKSLGWKPGTYDTAVGIRVDEIDRVSPSAAKNRLLYPLVSRWPTTKPEINEFWRRQPFRLDIKAYQGNCSWCWKKSFRKHYTLLWECPSIYDFPERMEAEHGLAGHNVDGTHRVFFRETTSTKQLRRKAEEMRGQIHPADDESQVYLSPHLDDSGGCEESCDVDFSQLNEEVTS